MVVHSANLRFRSKVYVVVSFCLFEASSVKRHTSRTHDFFRPLQPYNKYYQYDLVQVRIKRRFRETKG